MAGPGLLSSEVLEAPASPQQARGFAHHFTVDVEEYYQVSAFENYVPRSLWPTLESRVLRSTLRLLDLLDGANVRATFFVLGWVAERHPELIRQLSSSGHEIASHGWGHRRVTHLEPQEFRLAVRRTKQCLEDLTGKPVLGFRAPSFSIVPGQEWALDVLLEEGHVYDSSLFPVRRQGYGYPGACRHPHWLKRPAGRLLEVPPTTLCRWGANLPAAGGAYLRLLPYMLIRAALAETERHGAPGTFYIHPWELDPDQPRIAVPWPTRVRHYGRLAHVEARVRRLLREFRFQRIADTVTGLES